MCCGHANGCGNRCESALWKKFRRSCGNLLEDRFEIGVRRVRSWNECNSWTKFQGRLKRMSQGFTSSGPGELTCDAAGSGETADASAGVATGELSGDAAAVA